MGNWLMLGSAWVSADSTVPGGQLLTWQCLSENLMHHENREPRNVRSVSSRSFRLI